MAFSTFETSQAPSLSPARFVCMKGPGRPQCKHYVRQLVPFEGNSDHNDMERYCTKLRDESGELVSLKNQEVLACELRDPPDPASQALLDEHDAEILRRAAERETQVFDFESALEEK
jgi:hypothetical protein